MEPPGHAATAPRGGALAGRAAIVVGAGIAGLAAALALARRGALVRVFEQAPTLGEFGAGLQVGPNGAAVLAGLGLRGRLADAAMPAAGVILREGRGGGRLAGLDPGKRAGREGWLFHRADLVALLAEGARAAGVVVLAGRRVRGAVPGERPEVLLEDGTAAAADLVVGADGLHSVVRAAVGPAPPARFTGQVAWRALIPGEPGAPALAETFLGPGRHLVSYPLRGSRLRNLVAVEARAAWAAEGWQHRDDPAALRQAFAGFGGPVPRWLAAVSEVHLWGLFRHPVALRWVGGGVAILGDAAHPTLPFLAQGANMALEDAWVLAASLDAAADREAGLAAYQRAREGRVRRVVAAADAHARAYHLRGLPRLAGHLGLRLADRLARGRIGAHFDWLYRHDVTGAERPPLEPPSPGGEDRPGRTGRAG
ncbi:MAG: FAD-dependent monooxygenase [Rhodobacteraceae bacterium]|nr:FAD-dependent monooxygenase [Paracoccaceae bacterium]